MRDDSAGTEELEPRRALLNTLKVTAPQIGHNADPAQLLQCRAEHVAGQTAAHAVPARVLDRQDHRLGRVGNHVQDVVQAIGPVVAGAGRVLRGGHRVADHRLLLRELTTQLQRGIPCDRIADFEVFNGIGDCGAVNPAQRVERFGRELRVRHCSFLRLNNGGE